MSLVSDAWEKGDPYERYIGRWSRRIAPLFLSWLDLPPGRRWLDVGCGTGALCASIVEQCSPSSVTGVEPSEGFLETARARLAGSVSFHRGDAMALPLESASVDVVVSGLVLNFVPDPHAALIEMSRVAGYDGTIAAYVWDYAGKMELIRAFWDAAVALDPGAAQLDEGKRFPLCNPEALTKLFVGAGLVNVEVKIIDVATGFVDFEDFWQPFLGGQGPAPAYLMSLDASTRARLKDRLQESIRPQADRSIHLIARAWAIRGSVESG
jgi:SAM-dependent methyltransferase